MKKYFILILFLVFGFIASPTKPTIKNDVLYITGNIDNRYNNYIIPDYVTKVVLDSPGGSVYIALNLAKQIQKREIKTYAVNQCSSACFYIFESGIERTTTPETIFQLNSPKINKVLNIIHPVNIDAIREDIKNSLVDDDIDPDFVDVWISSEEEITFTGKQLDNLDYIENLVDLKKNMIDV